MGKLTKTTAQIEDALSKAATSYQKPEGGIPAEDLDPDVFLQGPKGDKGDTGATGPAGANGTNGVSVSSVKQTTTSTADGGINVVTVTLSNGATSTFTVRNGSKGSSGSKGANGANGVTFTPSVDASGNLSWTNNGGLANPATVNIKGPKGDSGSGGGGSGESYAGNYPIVRQSYPTLAPNTFTIYNFGLSGLTSFSFGAPANTSVANEYIVAFYIKASSAVVTLPASVAWGNDDVPALEGGYTYIFSVVDNVALYTKAKGNIYNIQTAAGGDN